MIHLSVNIINLTGSDAEGRGAKSLGEEVTLDLSPERGGMPVAGSTVQGRAFWVKRSLKRGGTDVWKPFCVFRHGNHSLWTVINSH
jgi:hypothetical protein